jgi:hypothetical protein
MLEKQLITRDEYVKIDTMILKSRISTAQGPMASCY